MAIEKLNAAAAAATDAYLKLWMKCVFLQENRFGFSSKSKCVFYRLGALRSMDYESFEIC